MSDQELEALEHYESYHDVVVDINDTDDYEYHQEMEVMEYARVCDNS